MRNKEQFKAYVYAKAEAAQAKGRKRRRLICSGIAACSVCICVVSAVFLAPHSQMDASNEMVENAFYAGAMPETEATEACRQDTLDFLCRDRRCRRHRSRACRRGHNCRC